ncbi:MAG: hypothetical protein O7H41_06740 [Planctomycetota bacterium]|nr:hypothetical protein [Planctomycetota bacterium]
MKDQSRKDDFRMISATPEAGDPRTRWEGRAASETMDRSATGRATTEQCVISV